MSDLAFPSPSEIADRLPVGRYGGPATIDNPPLSPDAEPEQQSPTTEPTPEPKPKVRRRTRKTKA